MTVAAIDSGQERYAGSVGGEATGDVLVVRLGDGRFALKLSAVAEVGKPPAVSRVPGVPAWLLGVANWRGRLLPVLDVRSRFGAELRPPTRKTRLVVVGASGVTVGLLVDAVEGTGPLEHRLDEVPPALAGPGAELLAGQVPRDDGPVALIDVDKVIRLRDSLPRAGRNG